MTDKYKTLCPDCDGEMVSRTGQYGVFWGCKAYPKCKGTRDSMGRSKADREEWKKEQATKQGEDYELDTKDETNRFSFKRTK
jgi:ssDNA-binding Zn-finger/Zn-ribbon topoisomerase 1